MIGDTATRLRNLAMRLKTGQYDGTDIMQAWIALRQFADLQWQPIETAPKDSLPRLYYCKRKVVQGFVDATGQLTVQHELGWREMRRKPTHWMPLPPEPETSEGTEATL